MKEGMIRTMIVDDMPHAVDLLRADITMHCPTLEFVGAAHGVVEAAKLFVKLKPDLLLLDISLGDGTGFDLLDIIGFEEVKVIFTTAYDEYAIKAFKYAAVDYLLKPIDIQELIKAVQKVKSGLPQSSESIDVLKDVYQRQSHKITLKTSDQILVAKIADIIRCQSDNNCTWFYFVDGSKLLISKTLKYYQQLLEENNFMRVHQSHLINFQHFKNYSKKDGGYIVMTNEDQVPVSIRKKQELMERMEK